jgi:hypothetical protein
MLYVAALKQSVVYTVMVLVDKVRSPVVKIDVSIGVTASICVTTHDKEPQDVRLLTLVTAVSVQLKTAAAFLTMYVKTGDENLVEPRNKVSEKHGLVTKTLKFYVLKIVGNFV